MSPMGTRRSVLPLSLALASFAAPAAAQTEPPKPATPPSEAWARTGPVGAPAPGVSQPVLTFTRTRRALLGWSRQAAQAEPRGQVAAWEPGAEPGPAVGLPGRLAVAPVPIGRGRALLAVEHITTRTDDDEFRVSLRTAVRGSTGAIGRWRSLARYTGAGAAAAAISPTGDVALAWIETRPPARGEEIPTFWLRFAIRPPGRAFGPPMTAANLGDVEHPGFVTVAVAYDSLGRLLIVAPATRTSGRRRIREVIAITGRPGALRRTALGPQKGVTEVVAGTSPTGRAVVAWWTQDGGEEANLPLVVHAATRGRGAGRFGSARVVDPGDAHDRTPGRITLAVGADGAALLAWSQVRRTGSALTNPVVAASAPLGRGFGSPVMLDPDGAAGDVAIAPDGSALVVWSRILRGNEQEPDQIFAALRGADAGSFGEPEAVSEADVATRPAAGFVPATNRPVVVWSERPGDAPPPEQGGAAEAVVRAAVRSGG